MYPPISANSRIAVKDDVIVAGGQRFHVPAGTHIACGVFQMHRRSDLWGEDANEWQPHRWMDGRGVPASNMYAFQAWGIGPRIVSATTATETPNTECHFRWSACSALVKS
jgi:cytochrome P450